MSGRLASLLVVSLVVGINGTANSRRPQSPPDGTAELIHRLADSDRAAAASSALVKLGTRACPQLVRGMAARNPIRRHRCGQVLREIGAPAIPFILRFLEDESPSLREAAAKALTYWSPPPPSSLEPLVTAVGDANGEVASTAGEAVARAPARVVVPRLQVLLRSGDADAVRGACWAIARFGRGGAEAVPELLTLVRDGDPESKLRATMALAPVASSSPQLVSRLLPQLALDAPSARLRRSTIDTLREVGATSPAAVRRALRTVALHDRSVDARAAALRALLIDGKVPADLRSTFLIATQSPSDQIAPLAWEALAKSAREDPSAILSAAHAFLVHDRARAAPASQYLVGSDRTEVVGVFAAALTHEDPWIVKVSLLALAKFGPRAKRALPALRAGRGAKRRDVPAGLFERTILAITRK